MRLVLRTLATTSAMALAGCSLFQQDQPHEARITLHLADTALAAGAPALALRVADIVLENHPNDVAAMIAKADALYALGSVDAARDEYRKVVALRPANPDAQIGLGRTLVKSDPRAAERAFQAALAHRPNSEPALNDLGIALDLQGRHAEAQKAYRQALGVSPDNADVRTNLNLSVALADNGVNGAGMRSPIATAPQAAPPSVPMRPVAMRPVPIGHVALAVPRDNRTEAAVDGGDQADWTAAPRDHAASHMAPAAPIDVARHDNPPAKPDTPPIIAQRPPAPEPIAPPAAKVATLTTPGSATEPVAAPWPEKATPGLDQSPAPEPAPNVASEKAATPAPAPEPASPPQAPPAMITADGEAEIPVPTSSPQPAPATAPEPTTATLPVVHPATASASAPPTPPPEPTRPASAASTAPSASTASGIAGVAADDRQAPFSAPGQTANPPRVATAPTQPARDAKPAAAPHPNRWSVPGYYVQVAALGSPQSAQAAWQRMQARWPDLLAGRAPTVQQADVHQRTFWRLRTGLFASAGSANDFCARLRAAGSDCWAVASTTMDEGDRGSTPLTR